VLESIGVVPIAMRSKDLEMQHLDQLALAERWAISHRTLEQWRWQGKGPRFLKIGGRVLYRLADIEDFEAVRLHANTNGPPWPLRPSQRPRVTRN